MQSSNFSVALVEPVLEAVTSISQPLADAGDVVTVSSVVRHAAGAFDIEVALVLPAFVSLAASGSTFNCGDRRWGCWAAAAQSRRWDERGFC